MLMGIWVLFVLWMLQLAIPSREMRRDAAGNGIYYTIWALVLGTLLSLHYRCMAHAGHATQALRMDGVAVGLFLLGQTGLYFIRKRLMGNTAPQ